MWSSSNDSNYNANNAYNPNPNVYNPNPNAYNPNPNGYNPNANYNPNVVYNSVPPMTPSPQMVQPNIPFFRITMDGTAQNGEGMGGYTTYKIGVETSHDQYRESRFTVWRRYSDFVWLHQKLRERYKTALVPSLPEKEIFGKNDAHVIEYRRRELLRFLLRVTSHHRLCLDKFLREFFESSDEQLVTVKTQKPSETEKKTTGGGGFSFFGMLTTKFSPPVEKDPWFQRKDDYLLNLDNRYGFAKKSAYFLSAKNKEFSTSLTDICQKLTELKEVENREDPDLAGSLTKYTDATRIVSSFFLELSEKHTQDLADVLSDHHRMIKAIRDLLAFRLQLLSEYESTNTEFQTKKDKGESAGSLEEEVRRKYDTFNQSSEEIKAEIEKYEKLKSVEIRAALIRVVEANMNQYQRLFEAYQKARADLAREPLL